MQIVIAEMSLTTEGALVECESTNKSSSIYGVVIDASITIMLMVESSTMTSIGR